MSVGMEGTKPAVTPKLPNAEALSAMMKPVAPLSSAFCALTENPQLPRSITAILPLTAPALAHELAAHGKVGPAQQPSDVAPTPSSASTRSLVTENSNGPHPAVPTGCLTPAIAGGE